MATTEAGDHMDIDACYIVSTLPGRLTTNAPALPLRPVAWPAMSTRFAGIQQPPRPASEHSIATVDVGTSSNSMTLAFRPRTAAKTAARSPSLPAAITQHSAFLSLPDELKVRTLSFLPAQEVASTCRAVCQDLCKFVDGSESRIAHIIIKRNQSRLQQSVDKMGCNVRPKSSSVFINGFRTWVEQRGIVSEEPESTLKSFGDWVLTTFRITNRKKVNKTRGNTAQLSNLVKELIELQLVFDHEVRHYGYKYHSTLQHYLGPGIRIRAQDRSNFERACRSIYHQPNGTSFFAGRKYDDAQEEQAAFPRLRLTEAKSPGSNDMLDPICRPQDVAQLGLPSLSDKTFFYYVEQDWCCNALAGQLLLEPLKKAAILDLVKFF